MLLPRASVVRRILRPKIKRQAAAMSTVAGDVKPVTKPPTLVMQIIVRRDLQTEHGWPVGPLMAQAAHAATAVLEQYRDTSEVKAYLADLGNMRKVVMEAPGEKELAALAEKLDALEPRIPYYLWVEQPENTPTAIALAPNPRPKALKKVFSELDIGLWK